MPPRHAIAGPSMFASRSVERCGAGWTADRLPFVTHPRADSTGQINFDFGVLRVRCLKFPHLHSEQKDERCWTSFANGMRRAGDACIGFVHELRNHWYERTSDFARNRVGATKCDSARDAMECRTLGSHPSMTGGSFRLVNRLLMRIERVPRGTAAQEEL